MEQAAQMSQLAAHRDVNGPVEGDLSAAQ